MHRWKAFTRPTVLFLLALVPLVAALWVAPFLPTHDGPKTLYASHVFWHAGDPAFAHEFTRSYPLTSMGFTLLYGPLERLFGWRIAYGLTWTFAVLTLPLGLARLAQAMHRDRSALGLVGVAGAVHWSVHMGFANYVASIGIGLFVLALGLEQGTWSVRRELSIYALMLFGCTFHPVGAQLAAVSLFAYRALGTTRERLVRELGATALGCVPALVITIISRDTLEDLRLKGKFIGRVVDLTWTERLDTFLHDFMSGPLWRVVPFLALGAVGLLASVKAWLHPRVERRTVALCTVGLIGLLGVVLAPMDSASWQFMQPRFLPLMIFPACVLVPVERLPARAKPWLAGALFVFAIASNVWVYREHARFAEDNRVAYSALGLPAEKGRTLLPILATEENSWTYQHDSHRPIASAARNLNLGQVYGVDRSAIVPYAFAFLPNIHPIVARGTTMAHVPVRDYGGFFAPGADPAVRQSELVRLGTFGTTFDDVLFVGAESDAAAFQALGYETEARGEGFLLGHLVGCPFDIHVAGDVSEGALFVGWSPADRVVETLAVGGDATRDVHIAKGSCGSMWVRLGAGAGERCRGANDAGVLSAPADARSLSCVVER